MLSRYTKNACKRASRAAAFGIGEGCFFVCDILILGAAILDVMHLDAVYIHYVGV